MIFWAMALAAALATAFAVARPLALARRASRPRAAHDEQVFRDQLSEVDRDLERGVLGAEEARAARIEVSRRLLAAAAEREAAPDHQPAPKRASFALAAVLMVGAPLGAVALYGALGAPGLPDQPLAARDTVRPAQAVAEAQVGRLPLLDGPEGVQLADEIAQLEARLAAQPGDRQAQYLLASALAGIGRYAEGWRQYAALMEATGGDAPAAIHAAMAEAMILAAQGYVSPEAEVALEQALRREPRNPVARYYMGAAFAQANKPQSAMQTWAELLRDSPPDAPWVGATRARIDALAQATGLARPQGAGPAPDARPAMLAMVRTLDARLAAQGGGPEQWAQLARSFASLGMTAEADDARTRARAALADDAGALAAFETALAEAAPLPGPSPEDVAAAAAMEAEQRAAMIAGMVERLRERLYAEGGEAEEWAQLIQSMGVLGDVEGAADAYARGAAAHRSDSIAVAMLKERALLAGADVP